MRGAAKRTGKWLAGNVLVLAALCLVGTVGCAEGGRNSGGGFGFPDPDSGIDVPPRLDGSDLLDGAVPDAPPADAGPDAPAYAGVSLKVISATVFTTKVNGDNWDLAGAAPDLVVQVYYANGTKSAETTVKNTFMPRWDETIIEGATEAEFSVLDVQVLDMDDDELVPSAADKVGRCTYDWNPLWPGAGPVTLGCARDTKDPDQSGFGLYVEFTAAAPVTQ